MAAEPTVHVVLRLPASVMAALPEIVSAATGLPAPATRSATVTAALGALIAHARQSGTVRPPPRYTEAVVPRRSVG